MITAIKLPGVMQTFERLLTDAGRRLDRLGNQIKNIDILELICFRIAISCSMRTVSHIRPLNSATRPAALLVALVGYAMNTSAMFSISMPFVLSGQFKANDFNEEFETPLYVPIWSSTSEQGHHTTGAIALSLSDGLASRPKSLSNAYGSSYGHELDCHYSKASIQLAGCKRFQGSKCLLGVLPVTGYNLDECAIFPPLLTNKLKL
ncbi:hypothetical protein V1527DRAFT_45655 [Lipomyces starkeyi]